MAEPFDRPRRYIELDELAGRHLMCAAVVHRPDIAVLVRCTQLDGHDGPHLAVEPRTRWETTL